jgi:ribonuclease P protein component
MSGPALSSLRVRRDYLAAAKAKEAAKQVRRGLVLQARLRARDEIAATPIRFGLTASKKTGNAVTRNRIRRRLRALAQELLPQYGQSGYDYVMIGRVHTVARSWSALKKDLSSALTAIHTEKSEKE